MQIASTVERVAQEQFGDFTVTCNNCGSKNINWYNCMGYSPESGGWGEAGFQCQECGTNTDMIESR